MKLDRKEVNRLTKLYLSEMEHPMPMSEEKAQTYDEGYIDGVVDTLGDLITSFNLSELNHFSEKMEEMQTKIYDRRDGK